MATKLEMLQAAATEINGIKINGDAMFNNQIDPALTTIPAMKKAILAEVDGELYVSDEERFTPETWKVLVDIVKVKVLADPDAAGEKVVEEKPAPKAKPETAAAKKKRLAAEAAAKKEEPEVKKAPAKKAPATNKGPSQAKIINDRLAKKQKPETIVKALCDATGKDEKWGKARLAMHMKWLEKQTTK